MLKDASPTYQRDSWAEHTGKFDKIKLTINNIGRRRHQQIVA